VTLDDPKSCPACTGNDLEQDSDVLDTWFSSALWPFSVFHWPKDTDDLKRFYPTSTLVTGHEILYLWVARMVMFGLEFMGKVPFETVLIHGIVRDKQGRKMSKSLGNVIDPLDLIKEFGADAVRFSLAQSAAPGRDMQISKENFVMTRNFSNKVWNATRFSLMNLAGMAQIPARETWEKNLELADQWILHRFNEVIRETTKTMESMDLDAASRGLYDFFWGDFCDWYLEMVKPRLLGDNPSAAARATLATVLDGTLRLLHPFMPFITEELWQKIPHPAGESATHLMAASWPQAQKAWDNKNAYGRMQVLQEMVTKLRAIRSEMGIPVTQQMDVVVKSSEAETISLIENQKIILQSLNSRVGNLTVDALASRPKASAAAVIPGADIYVPLEGLIDFAKERARLEKELQNVKEDTERMSKKLANHDFVTHAPKEEVEKAQVRLRESKERASRLEQNINALS
jgi:valyl-tRNA synthetase